MEEAERRLGIVFAKSAEVKAEEVGASETEISIFLRYVCRKEQEEVYKLEENIGY